MVHGPNSDERNRHSHATGTLYALLATPSHSPSSKGMSVIRMGVFSKEDRFAKGRASPARGPDVGVCVAQGTCGGRSYGNLNEPIALVACHVTVMFEVHGKSH